MKRLVKRALHRLGLDIIRHSPAVERGFPVLPYLVRERLHPGFFFVQVGANDGVHGDPMRALILDHDLAGILVEPLPDLFARLRANYADRPKLHFENVAIGSEDGAMTIYRVRPDTPNAPRWWFDLASVDSSFMARHGVPAAVVETLTVPSITFQTLLGRHGKTHVDLLQVDTEGHDSIIVRAALAAGFSPGIINFESCHLPPSDRYELKQSLAAHGYRFIDIDRDTLAVRVELDGETAAPNGRQGG